MLASARLSKGEVKVKRWFLICLLLVIVVSLPFQGQASTAIGWLAEPGSSFIQVKSDSTTLQRGVRQSFSFSVSQPGDYTLLMTYRPLNAGIFDNIVLLELGNQTLRTNLPFLWQDKSGEKKIDLYGNEMLPQRELYSGVSNAYVMDYASFSRRPFVFTLAQGTYEISITAQNQDIVLEGLSFVPQVSAPSYKDYLALYKDIYVAEGIITLEAEQYSFKNDPFIRGTAINNTALHPYDAYTRRINAIADKSLRIPGQKVMYTFQVEQAGLYVLAFSYSQPVKSGMPVFYDLQVDGEVPHQGFLEVAFPYTGQNTYKLLIPGGQVPYYLHLESGKHTLALAATAHPVDNMNRELSNLIGKMNAATLQVKKLTGQNSDISGSADVNRTWNITEYLPDIISDLQKWEEELINIYQQLKDISGEEPTFANDLLLAAENLRRLYEDPRKLPSRVSLLSDDATSAAQLVGSILSRLTEQNLSLDRIYLYNGKIDLPSPEEKAWNKARVEVQQFLHSFSPEMNMISDSEEQILQIWVNKPSQYVEVMRDLTTRGFTRDTGIQVAFSIMPNEDKLILANASGTNPDLVLGASIGLPFNFAVRGIARNLLEYDDFSNWYAQEYNLEGLVPYSFDGGVYAACETNDFKVLFYRKDILDSLGLQVPDTMDQVRAMMPTLHRNAMNFSLPLSSDREGYKGFQQTTPFIYQNGGDVYSKDGMRVTLNNTKTILGLQEMTDLYRMYGLLLNVRSFFNSFRAGSIPLGISDFATYILLQTTAPELAGLWDIALVPGTRDASGQVLRYQAAVDSGAMIMQNAAMPKEAYTFFKWWLSSDTQLEFATELQLKFGPEYKWNTANLVAFAQMAYPDNHKQIILSMWRDWQKETQRHIAVYMVERELSNLWGAVARDGKELLPQVDAAEAEINREIERKLIEYGYLATDGKILKPYDNNTVDRLRESMVQP